MCFCEWEIKGNFQYQEKKVLQGKLYTSGSEKYLSTAGKNRFYKGYLA